MAMREYDVIVIGAGINGAGVAQAAAAAGHSVLLLDKSTPGSGTSSRSSKLIHGGLRYLESGEFGLVRESLRERALMLKLAPDLVQMKDFYIPLYKGGRRGPALLRIGLSLYWLLAGGGAGAAFRTVPRRLWDRLDGICTRDLKAVFHYHDAQTDDQRLTQAVVHSAAELGADVAFPARVVGLLRQAGGYLVDYRDTGHENSVFGSVVVNAAGPWANEVLAMTRPATSILPVELVRGTHIVLDGHPLHGFYYLESPRDGRAVFAMPWKGKVLVGTTETRFAGRPDAVRPLRQEIRYLCRIVRHYFPAWKNLSGEKVDSAFAGLRVLPPGEGHAFHRSREIRLHPDRPPTQGPPRLLTLYGGKLTVWRATAEKVMERIAASLPQRKTRARTGELRLS